MLFRSRNEVSIDNTLLVLRTPAESQFHLPDAWMTERVVSLGGMDMHLLRKQRVTDEGPLDAEVEELSGELPPSAEVVR